MRWRAVRRDHVIALALFVAAALAFRLSRGSAGYWMIDDAGITYAASFELAEHGSLAPYLGGTPIEGYSNPLLFFVVALLRLVHAFDPVTTHLALEMVVFAAMVTLVLRLLRRVTGELAALAGALAFAALELAVPSTWLWYGSGLENVWVSAGLVALVWLCVRTSEGVALHPAWGALAFALSITRPEAPVYALAGYAVLLALARPSELALRTHAIRIARAAAVTVALYVVFLAWRRLAYHAWWPNTYYAKVDALDPLSNIRDHVIADVFPYARSSWFASCVLALLVVRKLERLALGLVVFLVAGLTLPIMAGGDWMGELRFATPFFAIAHLCYATFLASCVAALRESRRMPQLVAAIVALVLPLPLLYNQLSFHNPPWLSPVTLGRVAHEGGALRWEHQMRLGLPYAAVLTPDMGGALLVGGMQTLDNGRLTDFQMARLGRKFDTPLDGRVLDQYEHRERRPDLLDPNPFWPLNRLLLGTMYVSNDPARELFARSDLVELTALDPAAELVLEHDGMHIYLSPETVEMASPGALIRCELVVAWTTALDPHLRLRAAIGTYDSDELSLVPYKPGATGLERRAILVGAPRAEGPIAITFELWRDRTLLATGRPIVIDVTTNPFALRRAADALATAPTPMQAAQRVAWLRAQTIPRLPMHELHALADALHDATERREATAGRCIEKLRWNARVDEALPPPLRAAQDSAIHRVLGACGTVRRVLCLGRAVDDLRRLGYLDPLAREPAIAKELAADPPAGLRERYEALVGITLARPADLERQRQLLAARLALARAGDLPTL